MAKLPPCTLEELQRQVTIRDRQLQQFINARPRARFAYASHMTKTERKIGWIINGLHGDDLKKALDIVAPGGHTVQATPTAADAAESES